LKANVTFADIAYMGRIGNRSFGVFAISGALIGAGILGFGLWSRFLFSKSISIEELQELPVGSPAHLEGKVTYADVPGMRFWIQDQTGAIAIPQSPSNVGVHIGDTVAIDATKASRYDPVQGPGSLLLANVSIHPSFARIKLSQPVSISLNNLPGPEKNGIGVQINVIVREAYLDVYGRAHLNLTDVGTGIEAVVAQPPTSVLGLVDAKVRIAGISEQTVSTRGERLSQRIWVSSAADIRVIQPAPGSDDLYSIRDLYRKNLAANDGHRIRIRGHVRASSEDSLLIEDPWGAIECHLTGGTRFPIGKSIEVNGFPGADGLRIDLYHARITEIPEEQVNLVDKNQALPPPLKTVAAVRQLTPSRAALALPVRVTGVITASDPMLRQIFFQDQSGGVFLKYSGSPPGLRIGERVTINGITDAGNYAPVILAPKFEAKGPTTLPVPIPVTFDDAAAGRLDSQYVSVEGVIHPLKFAERPDHPILTFELYTAFGQIHVSTSPGFPDFRASGNLEDARVRIQGAFGTIFNSRRQLVGYQLSISSPSQIDVIEPPIPTPFALETTPIGNLLRFSPGSRFGHRVKVSGSVAFVGQDLVYIEDVSGGVEIRGSHPGLHLGDRIEAVGYPTLAGRYSPVLSDATLRAISDSQVVQPIATTAQEILLGKFDSQLVTVEGRLLTALPARGACTLVLQSGAQTFTAQLDIADLGTYSCNLTEGSVLRLTGISSAQIDPTKLYRLLQEDPATFKILLRGPEDIAIVRFAPFWTPRNMFSMLAFFSLMTVVILAWVSVLRRRVRKQMAALQRAAQTTQAIHDLSVAMQEVSHEERFDAEVSVQGTEDIAHLVVAFNRMLAELRQRDRAKRDAEMRLQHQALIDELTGLPNRRLLSDRLGQSLATARRENSKLALLYIDLDGFKLVNDSFGHAAGDILLKEVSRRFRSRIRDSDTLARIGGDEFTVILNRIHSKEDAEKAASDLLESLVEPFFIEGREATIGASIGISVFPEHGLANDDLLQQADNAMYVAKRRGTNRIAFFSDDLGVSVLERFTLEHELRHALTNGELSVHYQPEFDILTNVLVRFEALARWTHPTMGVIPPLQFIPVAEECGLIVPLGAYVLERACMEALTWQELADRPIQVAVNVSSVQFARNSFVEEVIEILERTGLRPDLLQLELTESATLISIHHASETMQRLKDIGVSMAMDDFGTGYSCLSYLPKLAFDALKIDRSFVRELMTSPEARALVESILTLARNLHMKVIVEGIESEEQLALLGELGGDEAQGYLLGRPGPDPSYHLRHRRAPVDGSRLLKELSRQT
jgi:diguanylate cyclase (GGDEF)-like protein